MLPDGSGPRADLRRDNAASHMDNTADESRVFRVLRTFALAALVAGAAGSVAFMGYVGRHNNSALLIALFTVWVLSPFVVLAAGLAASRRWSLRIQQVWSFVTIAVALGSLAIYGNVAVNPRPQPAFLFIVVPPASWLVIAIAAAAVALLPNRPPRTDGPGSAR
jgi:hypothetical protein